MMGNEEATLDQVIGKDVSVWWHLSRAVRGGREPDSLGNSSEAQGRAHRNA